MLNKVIPNRTVPAISGDEPGSGRRVILILNFCIDMEEIQSKIQKIQSFDSEVNIEQTTTRNIVND